MVDTTDFAPEFDAPLEYMRRTREYYLALGYDNPYRWAHYTDAPFTPLKKPLKDSTLALISTAGLHRRGDRPFRPGDGSYRVIPAETPARDLVMSHISVNFDRTGFQQDHNVAFPIDRLRELVDEGVIGSMASMHYSFMGAFPPDAAEPHAQHLAGLLKQDAVDAALLVPV